MRIVLDSDLCTGHDRYHSLGPERFDTDDEVHSVSMAQQAPVGLESQARLAVQNCPERCISIEE